jgi:hypothetical protein
MQNTLDVTISSPVVSEVDAQQAVSTYVTTHLDPAFMVVNGTRYYHKVLEREVWQFIIRSEQAPLDAIYIDTQTGEVFPLLDDQIRMVRERAAIAEAKTRGALPVDEHGYVLAEYARRKTNGYLSGKVSLFCGATDGVLIPLTRPIWQFAIRFGLPRLGELGILGTIDVDAHSGEVIPLMNQQIKRMRARADAIVEFQTQTAAA